VLNKRGQALIEFVIILPVLVMLLFGIVDFGKILLAKMNLENKITDVVAMINDNKNKEEIINNIDKNIEVNITNKNNDIVVELNTKVTIMTPGLNLVLKNPYKVKVSRVINNE
jgi:Flp pilus assembly protein TadG